MGLLRCSKIVRLLGLSRFVQPPCLVWLAQVGCWVAAWRSLHAPVTIITCSCAHWTPSLCWLPLHMSAPVFSLVALCVGFVSRRSCSVACPPILNGSLPIPASYLLRWALHIHDWITTQCLHMNSVCLLNSYWITAASAICVRSVVSLLNCSWDYLISYINPFQLLLKTFYYFLPAQNHYWRLVSLLCHY
jgi:hypothetical protein